jgi:Zn-finger nucleic acid-binding protein
MLVVEFEGVELDACPRCRGSWFDADELRVLLLRAGTGDAEADVEAALGGLARGTSRGRRRCPRCRRRLAEVAVPSMTPPLEVDVCARGDGFWFDRGELPRFVSGSISEDRSRLAAVREFLGRFAKLEEA